LLGAAARPGQVEAATVDHRLRPGSGAEAADVARLCKQFGVPHATLAAQWDQPPETGIQQRARLERYRLLGQWARDRGLGAVATGHHMGDQVETFMMRLTRGAGVRGLGAMRPVARLVGGGAILLRPLLGWTRGDLEAVCDAAGVDSLADPSNSDEQFERVRVRKALAATAWIDPMAIARSAANLGSADAALEWATDREWDESVSQNGSGVTYRPTVAPWEIRRRIIVRAIELLATEGEGIPPGGREVDQIIETLASAGTTTLRGVLCSGGDVWKFEPAPPRRQA
jgi:tRNA(Ile)-lysidine synthase